MVAAGLMKWLRKGVLAGEHGCGQKGRGRRKLKWPGIWVAGTGEACYKSSNKLKRGAGKTRSGKGNIKNTVNGCQESRTDSEENDSLTAVTETPGGSFSVGIFF